MRKLRCPQASWIRRLAATALAVVLLQGFAGTLWHMDAVDHYWCDAHQHVTHDGDHAAAGAETRSEAPAVANSLTDTPDRDHSPGPNDESGCQWLTWLHDQSISFPPIYAQLLNLPPPSELRSPPLPTSQSARPHPVDLEHLAPKNSPPRV